MSEQQPNSRARLKALLAIPERERTDEQWDEIHRLEIETLPDLRAPVRLPRPEAEAAPPPGAPRRRRWRRRGRS